RTYAIANAADAASTTPVKSPDKNPSRVPIAQMLAARPQNFKNAARCAPSPRPANAWNAVGTRGWNAYNHSVAPRPGRPAGSHCTNPMVVRNGRHGCEIMYEYVRRGCDDRQKDCDTQQDPCSMARQQTGCPRDSAPDEWKCGDREQNDVQHEH